MICVKCGAKEEPARKKKYLQLSQEFEDLVIKNKGGHPEPDDQVCKKIETYLHCVANVKAVWPAYSKMPMIQRLGLREGSHSQ